ncbi:serine/threonine protein kinase [Nannizzia gypsea CBS 118893]|uniref:Serine/threonine protein kinase n=1 Tax=Arthroderma gypseum (strain ATCC MYA-4604 / CBS 118893) TaxID=535722 RepID=E4UUY4_ARTGP|nr:serine/threonine protein kinase [Nannizzia gypsea CBS 118893]EFR01101.1 serine/threonine protein kinase [Nannizzia gypsea CBS 118893]
MARHDDTPRSDDFPDDDNSDLGDFVTTEREESDVNESSEEGWKYDKEMSRVFYPVCIGEILNDRYRIDHKLGHGGFSTVWLAYDLEKKTDVALKVTDSSEIGKYEAQIHEKIIRRVKDTSHILTYLRTFSLQGEGSNRHQVLVFPWVGECLFDLKIWKMTMASRMLAARHLLEALNSLHSAGIVHRDVTGYNCFQGIAPLENHTRKYKYERLGRPLKLSIEKWLEENIWKPGQLVAPVKIPEDLQEDIFYLGDFSLAINVGERVTPEREGRPPVDYCSPERLHGFPPSTACDMWSYMCVFSEFYLGFRVIGKGLGDGIIPAMVESLGPLPAEWKGRLFWEYEDQWYDQNIEPNPQRPFEDRIKRLRPDIDQAELELVSSLFRRGFRLEPEKRPTAAELLQDPSFKALMDRYT